MARSRNYEKSREEDRSGREMVGSSLDWLRSKRERALAAANQEIDLDDTGFRFELAPRPDSRTKAIVNNDFAVLYTGRAAHAGRIGRRASLAILVS